MIKVLFVRMTSNQNDYSFMDDQLGLSTELDLEESESPKNQKAAFTNKADLLNRLNIAQGLFYIAYKSPELLL